MRRFYKDNSDKDDNTPTKMTGVRIKMEAISKRSAERCTQCLLSAIAKSRIYKPYTKRGDYDR